MKKYFALALLAVCCFSSVYTQAQSVKADKLYSTGIIAYHNNDYVTSLKYLFAYRVKYEDKLKNKVSLLDKIDAAIAFSERQIRSGSMIKEGGTADIKPELKEYYNENTIFAEDCHFLKDMPTGAVKELICPDGTNRLIAVVEESVPVGIAPKDAQSIARRIATLKAKAKLADFINGPKFEHTAIFTDIINSHKESSEILAQDMTSYVDKIRISNMRNIGIFDIEQSGDSIKV